MHPRPAIREDADSEGQEERDLKACRETTAKTRERFDATFEPVQAEVS